ncbi:MAG: GNAT family N-acetyltransferase, partial [Tepidiformaceae bacterium]
GLAHHRFVLRAGADAALIAAARSAGLATGHEMPSMALEPLPGAPPPLPEGLRIRPVDDEADLALYTAQFIGADPEWDQVVKAIGRTAMSLPGFTLLLGLCDGEPVATSMAVVTGATVGIYNVGVDPRYRRRGFGSAMSLAAMAAGAAEGCRLAGLQASEMGYSMYEGLGFRTVETYLSMERT